MNTEAKERESLRARLNKLGCSDEAWNYLSRNMFPGHDVNTLLIYLAYCKERKLDPLKKPVEIVSFKEKYTTIEGYEKWRDRAQILPGVYEARLTAHRTGQYIGQTRAVLGKEFDFNGQQVPEFAIVEVQRAIVVGHEVIKASFTGEAFFMESANILNSGQLNSMWRKRPRSMLIKAAEALALRRAFPEEVGNMPFDDEVADSIVELDHDFDAKEEKPTLGETKDRKHIEHQKGNDLDDILQATKPKLQPVTADQGVPGDKPMDGKTIDREAKINPETKKKGKEKPPATMEPKSKIPVDDPPPPGALDDLPAMAPLQTGSEPPPYWAQGGFDLDGEK